MGPPKPLDVDGARPAAAWVTGLPRAWLSSADRHLLLLLALDTYDRQPPFEASPSTAQLCDWAGEFKGALLERVRRLVEPVPGVRPALLEVTPGAGRKRSKYRLRTEHDPALWSGNADQNGTRSGLADETTSLGRGIQTTSIPSGLPSGLASGRAPQTTPSPLPQERDLVGGEAAPTDPHRIVAEDLTRRHGAELPYEVALRAVRAIDAKQTPANLSAYVRGFSLESLAQWGSPATPSNTPRRIGPTVEKCQHGRADGRRIQGRGAAASRVCGECEAIDPAPEERAS